MPPDIIQIAAQTILVNSAYSVEVTINDTTADTEVTVTGLLQGFYYDWDQTNGICTIYGHPTEFYSGLWTVSAVTDADNSDQIEIEYRVVSPAPVISVPAKQFFTAGNAVDFTVDISNTPTEVIVSGPLIALEAELLEMGVGVRITGTVPTGVNFTIVEGNINIIARNNGGEDNQDIEFGLNTAPVIIDIPTTQRPILNTEFRLTLQVVGQPAPTWDAVSMPTGWSFNTTTGEIVGTSTTDTDFTRTFTARNVNGNDSITITFDIETRSVPSITALSTQNLNVGSAYSQSLTFTGAPAPTFTISNQPPGIDINVDTGVISGNPTAQGTYTATITATNSEGSDDIEVNFVVGARLTAPDFGTIQTFPNQTLTAGTAFSYTVAEATGNPTPTYSATDLPDGLNIGNTTRIISGTPTRTDLGINNVTVIATNSQGTDMLTSVFTVNGVPVMENIPAQSLTAGTAFSYTPTVTGYPTAYTFTATGLPDGVTIDASTGEISGTPTRMDLGDNSVSITVTNSEGSDTQTGIVFNVADAPVLANIPDQTLIAGTAFSYTPTVDGSPAVFTWVATGLPDGVTIDASTGEISGTPTRVDLGDNTISITVTNSVGSDSQSDIVFTVEGVPQITTIPNQILVAGTAFSYTPTVTGHPAITYSAIGLPDGVDINDSTGELSGTPTRTDLGDNTVTFTATNTRGTDTQNNITFTVRGLPVIAAIPNQIVTAGQIITTPTPVVSGYPTNYTFRATGLPDGITINSSSGAIDGIPTRVDLGDNIATIYATNIVGESVGRQVFFEVRGGPQITETIPELRVRIGEAFSYQVQATGHPAITYSATNFPSGITIDSATGEISGTSDATAGTVTGTITLTNSAATLTQDITFNVVDITLIYALDATDRRVYTMDVETANNATATEETIGYDLPSPINTIVPLAATFDSDYAYIGYIRNFGGTPAVYRFAIHRLVRDTGVVDRYYWFLPAIGDTDNNQLYSITVDDNYLYIITEYFDTTNIIYRVDKNTANNTEASTEWFSFNPATGAEEFFGATIHGGNLYLTDDRSSDNSSLHIISASTADETLNVTEIRGFTLPTDNQQPRALAIHGTNLFCGDRGTNEIHVFAENTANATRATEVKSFNQPTSRTDIVGMSIPS